MTISWQNKIYLTLTWTEMCSSRTVGIRAMNLSSSSSTSLFTAHLQPLPKAHPNNAQCSWPLHTHKNWPFLLKMWLIFLTVKELIGSPYRNILILLQRLHGNNSKTGSFNGLISTMGISDIKWANYLEPLQAHLFCFHKDHKASLINWSWGGGGGEGVHTWIKIETSPGWHGSVDWVPACEPKGHQFHPSQNTFLGCSCGPGPHPSWGCVRDNHTSMFLPLSFSFLTPLSMNEWMNE